MPDYGVTEKGFEIKRLDVILEEIHQNLTDGFGVDTRLMRPSFLNTLVTTFAGQIAELWETAQDSYYAKYPATATGVNLDNAVQYGGIRRAANRRTVYPLHCTGDDGTEIREEAVVATDTLPEIRLYSASEFRITREAFNSAIVVVAAAEAGIYSIAINGKQYSFSSPDGSEDGILNGLKDAVMDDSYIVSVMDGKLMIEDTVKSRNGVLVLSDNLTTASVTTIVNFMTQDYGKIMIPNGIVSKMVTNIAGFRAVTNLLEPTYGRLEETDEELRQSYLAKSAIRSGGMIDSIISQIVNNVAGVESATGYENDSDVTDGEGRPPHSIEIVVDGGSAESIAEVIFRKKPAGIQTFGKEAFDISTAYGDTVTVRFNRPEYIYVWMKVTIHANAASIPEDFADLSVKSILSDTGRMSAGESLISQMLNTGIYKAVSGVTYVDIKCATTRDKAEVPGQDKYTDINVMVSDRQKVVVDKGRIEVVYSGDS